MRLSLPAVGAAISVAATARNAKTPASGLQAAASAQITPARAAAPAGRLDECAPAATESATSDASSASENGFALAGSEIERIATNHAARAHRHENRPETIKNTVNAVALSAATRTSLQSSSDAPPKWWIPDNR
uniref:Unannotated protein n=1 Tax=freshwater metagenome TaxID=449393 RepID=A0A6J5ZZK6_9ZZZZ